MKIRCLLIIVMFASVGLHAVTVTAQSKMIEITVQKDDTLSNICSKYLELSHGWKEIARINHLNNPHMIYPGQKIMVPAEFVLGVPLDGKVTFLKGAVAVYVRATEQWGTPALNDRIAQGSRIRTGEESAAEITFEDGVSFLLRSNTGLEIASARKKSALHKGYRFFLDIGRTVSKIRHLTGEETRFEIRTPSAIAAARGTDFRVAANAQGDTRCEDLEGKIGILGKEQDIELQAGEGILIMKNRRPQSPRKLLPPPVPIELKSLYKSMPISLSFEKVGGAEKYRIMIARERDSRDLLVNKVISTSDRFEIVHLEDGHFLLQSRAIDPSGLEGPSLESVPFTVRVNPMPPFIQSPTDDAHYHERSIRFQWLNVREAVSYHVQVASDPDFNELEENQTNLDSNVFKSSPLDFGSHYFRARSIAADEYKGEWSDTLRFNIVPPPPSPSVEVPSVEDRVIKLRWRNLGEGISYHFQMAGDPGFEKIILDEKTGAPSIEFDRPDKPGKYFARISGIDSDGYEGNFSTPQLFEIKTKFPFYALGAILGGFVLLLLI